MSVSVFLFWIFKKHNSNLEQPHSAPWLANWTLQTQWNQWSETEVILHRTALGCNRLSCVRAKNVKCNLKKEKKGDTFFLSGMVSCSYMLLDSEYPGIKRQKKWLIPLPPQATVPLVPELIHSSAFSPWLQQTPQSHSRTGRAYGDGYKWLGELDELPHKIYICIPQPFSLSALKLLPSYQKAARQHNIWNLNFFPVRSGAVLNNWAATLHCKIK